MFFEFAGNDEVPQGILASCGTTAKPSLRLLRKTVSRIRSEIRALRIIVALHQHNVSVDDVITREKLLAIGVPESMVIDPCNGELLNINRENEMWKVWSVGIDQVDDGGDPHPAEDFVLGGKPWDPAEQSNK